MLFNVWCAVFGFNKVGFLCVVVLGVLFDSFNLWFCILLGFYLVVSGLWICCFDFVICVCFRVQVVLISVNGFPCGLLLARFFCWVILDLLEFVVGCVFYLVGFEIWDFDVFGFGCVWFFVNLVVLGVNCGFGFCIRQNSSGICRF